MKTLKSGRIFMILIPLGLCMFLMSCNRQRTNIDYKTAEGYFVLNTIPNDAGYEKKFTTQEDFDKYFDSAVTIGFTPTPIDFDNEYAAAFIAPVTDMKTTINVDSVIWNGRQAEMYFSIETGEKMSYSIRPVKILLIDKEYNGRLTSFVNGYKTKDVDLMQSAMVDGK